MVVIPVILVTQFADITSGGDSLQMAIVAAASFSAIIVTVRHAPTWHLSIKLPPSILWLFVTAVSVFCYIYMYTTTGLSLQFRSLGDVQDIRFAYRDDIATNGRLLGYLVRMQGNVLNPLIIAFGIYARRPIFIVAGILGQLLIFSATGYKLTLLSAIALLLVAAMFRLQQAPRGSLLLFGTISGCFIALLVDWAQKGLLYAEVFIDRLLLAPGVLVSEHVAVFQGQPKAKWAYSFLSGIIDYPYDKTPDFLVGYAFTRSTAVTANANLFADGYANLGYLGIVIEAGVLAALLWFVDSAASYLPTKVSALILLVPTVALANSSPFTSILSNGFLAAVICMSMLRSNGWVHESTGEESVHQATGLASPSA